MKQITTVIPLPIFKSWTAITYHIDEKHKYGIFITNITEDEEKSIDNEETVELKRNDATFIINKKNIYCYGEIDFHSNSEDFYAIEKFNFLNHLGFSGIRIYANYNYNNHSCVTDGKKAKYFESFNPAEVAQQAHGTIGKPKRTVIFRHMI